MKLPEHEEEFLDAVWQEMIMFSGMDTGFIENILEFAIENDDMYELASKYFQSSNTAQRKYYEEQMFDLLGKNGRL